MLVGLRILLLLALMAVTVAFLGFLFTRNPKLLQFCKRVIKVTLVISCAVALIYVLERLILVL